MSYLSGIGRFRLPLGLKDSRISNSVKHPGDMGGVGSSLARDLAGGQNARRQFRHLSRDIQQGKILERLEMFMRRDGVSRTLESIPSFFPPFPGEPLVARNYQIPARPRGQVARNGCLQNRRVKLSS
jgi:hypothetical protein